MRWGNWAVAKMIEALFNTTHLSDVGCTYRVYTRELADMIAEEMKIGGNHAGPEMMLLAITSGARFVEVPVNYLPRVGTSSATGKRLTAMMIGLRMVEMIFRFRTGTPRRLPRPDRLRHPETVEMTRETFDEIATIYDDSLPAHVTPHYLEKRVAYVTEQCPRAAGLDVGCGTGVLSARLAQHGYEMTGIDPSQAMLDVLERRAPEVRSVLGSGTDLPFESDGFDLVLTVAALHHIAEPHAVGRTLAEMVRVCKPGRADRRLGSQPAKSVLEAADGAGAPGRWIGAVDRRAGGDRRDRSRPAGGCSVASRLGFVPDFAPAGAMRPAVAMERAVERSPVRVVCAHNVVLARRMMPSGRITRTGARRHAGGTGRLSLARVAARRSPRSRSS